MDVVRTVAALREQLHRYRELGRAVSFIPTMGALHQGHISLLEVARSHAATIVVSIFVNPLQFGPKEDFHHYPRDPQNDSALLNKNGAHVLYVPDASEMYPQGFSTRVQLGALAQEMEGKVRPHFFEGVATVVLKFLLQVQPDVVVFGEKDYQQLCLMRKLVQELDIPVEIVGAPTVRDADGLAFSSRNRYLNIDERKIAPLLHKTLQEVREQVLTMKPVEEVTAAAAQKLLKAGFRSVDYIEVRDAATLGAPKLLIEPSRVLGAATLGNTRLIDNIPV